MSLNGATTLSIRTLSLMTLSMKGIVFYTQYTKHSAFTLGITTLCHYAERHLAECRFLHDVMLSFFMLYAIMLNFVMLSVVFYTLSCLVSSC